MALRNDQLSGAVGDFVRMAALGNTDADDLQRLACDLLGLPQPKLLTIEEMHSLAPTGGMWAANALTCEDYDPDAAMGEDYETGESVPLNHGTLTLTPADVLMLANVAGIADTEAAQ